MRNGKLKQKKGSTLPALEMQLIETDGTPVDLTNATQVKFRMGITPGSPKVDAAAVVVTASEGRVKYEWEAADVDTVGTYNGEWVVTFADGVQVVPSSGFVEVEIEANAA